MYVVGGWNINMFQECSYLPAAVLILVLIGEGRILFLLFLCTFILCWASHNNSAVDCQCEQNFVLPGWNLPQIHDSVDYNHSVCFTCNQNSFTLEAMGNPQMPVNINTSLVMISTTLVPGKFVLVIPDPRSALGSDSATTACDGESFRISKLGEERTHDCIYTDYDSACKYLITTNATVESSSMSNSLVFNPPTLSPSETTSPVEGSNILLSCSSNLNDVTITWTRGSTQLATATATSSLTHTITSIMRTESGNYTCTVVDTIGTNAFQLTRQSSVIVNVFCEWNNYVVFC